MARQGESCWACGVALATAESAVADRATTVVWASRFRRIAGHADSDEDRWMNDGGRGRPEPAAPLLAGATRR